MFDICPTSLGIKGHRRGVYDSLQIGLANLGHGPIIVDASVRGEWFGGTKLWTKLQKFKQRS